MDMRGAGDFSPNLAVHTGEIARPVGFEPLSPSRLLFGRFLEIR